MLSVLRKWAIPALAVVVLTATFAVLVAQTPATASTRRIAEVPAAREEPTYVLTHGDTGRQVRELQSRLFQLKLFPERTTGVYDAATTSGVREFQHANSLWASGLLTANAWQLLCDKTRQPTDDELFNKFTPGPPLFGPHTNHQGIGVRRMQARLKQISWYAGDVTGVYDRRTVEAVKGFQRKRRIPVTGVIDRRTIGLLQEMTRPPTRIELFNLLPPGVDDRCTVGRVLCIDKTTRQLRWMIDGKSLKQVDVRFGSDELPTREGVFSIFRKSRDHVSSIYDTSMPFAMFFSGGQAVHYSPDFAATGYNGASHGCVNVRDLPAITWLFDQVQLGDTVVIYRS